MEGICSDSCPTCWPSWAPPPTPPYDRWWRAEPHQPTVESGGHSRTMGPCGASPVTWGQRHDAEKMLWQMQGTSLPWKSQQFSRPGSQHVHLNKHWGRRLQPKQIKGALKIHFFFLKEKTKEWVFYLRQCECVLGQYRCLLSMNPNSMSQLPL